MKLIQWIRCLLGRHARRTRLGPITDDGMQIFVCPACKSPVRRKLYARSKGAANG
jgi:hypothetical protein